MTQIRNKKELKSIRSNLRKSMPAPEVVLWQKLRGGALGIKFRRQFSIQNHILDFYCAQAKLGIEIDGESHFLDTIGRESDRIRDAELTLLGIKILRFTNRDVMENRDGVLSRIIQELEQPPLNLPLFKKQGEKVH